MQRQGFITDVKVYNSIIDACRQACQWRRALSVFHHMTQQDIKPNTATYSVITDACARARIDDAPLVYESMKYCGVPEYLAYSTAQRFALKIVKKIKLGLASVQLLQTVFFYNTCICHIFIFD
jgi:pentatricopeptide repeat protein